MAKESYTFTWDTRKGERPAPELAMRIEPTDLYAWWWTGGSNARRLRDTGNGPAKLLLDIPVPSADAFPATPSEGFCVESESPYLGCRVALSRIVMERDDANWDMVDGLLGKRPIPAGINSAKSTTVEFWTREDRTNGRLDFMGWECGVLGWHSAANVLGPPPVDTASPLAQRSRCYRPDPDDERATKHKVVVECSEDRGCEMHFLYRQRYALVDAENLPYLDAPTFRGMTLITAWETLNRMHANASRPVVPTDALAEAKVQQRVCRALGKEAAFWQKRTADPAYVAAKEQNPSPYWGSQNAQKKIELRWQYMSKSCLRVGDIASSLVSIKPAEAEALLKDVATSLLSSGAFSSDQEALYTAWFAALRAQGKRKAMAMAHALALYLNHATSVGVGTPDWTIRANRAKQLKALRLKLRPTLSDQQLAEFTTPQILQYELEEEQLGLKGKGPGSNKQ